MTAFMIRAARLDLVLQTPEQVLAWVASLPAADRAEFSPEWLDRVRSTAAGDPWALGYAVIERASGVTVGGCSFKGPPDAEGVVEVAYGVDAPYRAGGFATEMTEALVAFAFTDGRVSRVRAHTKPDNAASARVLEKCGFRPIGDVIDPEDGLVRRWERVHPVGEGKGSSDAVPP
jgi:RimJ/RimL family protein N-acetyltransferase